MVIIDAIYQKGILKPLQLLNLPDNTRVRVQIIPTEEILAESRYKQHLVELGLLREIRIPLDVSGEGRTPIEVKGKPLSQAIIEERR
jgi:predicted DNA-binding antitoxin AbrB/MazE fold protein